LNISGQILNTHSDRFDIRSDHQLNRINRGDLVELYQTDQLVPVFTKLE
jgi:hypothetical protein